MIPRRGISAAAALIVLGWLTSAASGGAGLLAPTFSIDYQGPTIGVLDSWLNLQIRQGDILSPAPVGAGPPLGTPGLGPMPTPGISVTHQFLGLGGQDELDALSYGHDDWPTIAQPGVPDILHFSVDRFAAGDPISSMNPPDVVTEGVRSNCEAAPDVFKLWPPMMGCNTSWLDGNGNAPPGTLGVGLLEMPWMMPNPGQVKWDDSIDALDIDTTLADVGGNNPIYFSLDSGFWDPLEGWNNTGSAAAHGFVGGDVLVRQGGVTNVYASAWQLGLNLFGGVDSDDLDALILVEDGDGIYNLANDLLLFSVRRGSALIGRMDFTMLGPIEEGDILSGMFGGPGVVPGIFIPAEFLGLATMRSGTFGPFNFADDLNALDVRTPILGDTNDDGVIDIVDLTALAANWFTAGMGWTGGDFNGDGKNDIVDLTALAANWFTVGSAPPVPEPGCVALLVAGGLALLRRRKR